MTCWCTIPTIASTTSVEHFIRAAADDPRTVAIKMTVYRIGDDTPFVRSLIQRGRGAASRSRASSS